MTDGNLVILSVSAVCALEAFEFVSVRREGREVFSLKLHLRAMYLLFEVAAVFCSLDFCRRTGNSAKDAPYWFFPVFLFILVVVRPSMIVADRSGLTAFSFYGLRRRRVEWTDISRVTSEWHEEAGPLRGWPRFMGYSVDVRGSDGTKITHSVTLRRQARFLDVLREHVPESVFEAGIYDWRPERS